jgi:hypothetical protein
MARLKVGEETFIVQRSLVICHLRMRFARSFLKMPCEAHPQMTNGK